MNPNITGESSLLLFKVRVSPEMEAGEAASKGCQMESCDESSRLFVCRSLTKQQTGTQTGAFWVIVARVVITDGVMIFCVFLGDYMNINAFFWIFSYNLPDFISKICGKHVSEVSMPVPFSFKVRD